MAMMQKMSMMGLVRTANPRWDALAIPASISSDRLPMAAKSSMICFPTSPMLVPRPVISAENFPWSVTDNE